jgi:spore photoproduct lyase
MKKELGKIFESGKIFRIGTGEFTDSLIWERMISLSSFLVPLFATQGSAVLELKTKTASIECLKGLQHNRKTIAAWSLNTPRVIQEEEQGTASLLERLEAASRCQEWGYPLAFHFDPLVIYDGCEEEYRKTVEFLFSKISTENITWISLGSFRFPPAFKTIFQKRHANSRLPYGEFICGLDNKMRYFKPLRIRLYRKMIEWIRNASQEVRVYLCMEDDEVWKKTIGYVPQKYGGLKRMLDESAIIHCGLKEDFRKG